MMTTLGTTLLSNTYKVSSVNEVSAALRVHIPIVMYQTKSYKWMGRTDRSYQESWSLTNTLPFAWTFS